MSEVVRDAKAIAYESLVRATRACTPKACTSCGARSLERGCCLSSEHEPRKGFVCKGLSLERGASSCASVLQRIDVRLAARVLRSCLPHGLARDHAVATSERIRASDLETARNSDRVRRQKPRTRRPKRSFQRGELVPCFAVSKKDRKHCAVKLDASKGASSPRADEPLEKGDLVCGLLEGQTCVEPKKAGTLRRRESQQW